ncbi:dihydropteroate synthase [Chloroflexota bacterium]
MLVIGENINGSSTSVSRAINNRDEEFIENLVKAQSDAGADFIDVNSGRQETTTMEWLIKVIQATTDKPLAIDSDTPSVIEAALRNYSGDRLIINSVTAEPERLAAIGTLAAEKKAWLVALAMGEEGIPETVGQRLAACDVIMNYISRLGMSPGQILFDPLVLPISVDSNQGLITLETIKQIKSHYPTAKTVMGLSNISFGLPSRKLVNRAFMLMATYAGLDAVILNPLDTKMMSLIKIAEMLTGKDIFSRNYIRAYRKGNIVE